MRIVVPATITIAGIVLIVMGHARVNDVSDSASGSSVFTTLPTDRDSLLTAAGVTLVMVALTVVLFDWLVRLNSSDADERRREEQAREQYARTGRWPSER